MKHIRAPKAVIDKWLTALRSGRYKQGTWSLCKDNKYCCLGVLVKELGGVPEGILPEINFLDSHSITFFNKYDEKSQNPYLSNEQKYLDYLNDSEMYTFSQIADLIESEVEYI